MLDFIDYGMEINREWRHFLVVVDKFSKNGFGVPLQIGAAQKIRNSISNIIHTSKRIPSLIETDDGKESEKICRAPTQYWE